MNYRPVIHWKGLRVTAGQAFPTKGIIGLSYRVLKTEADVRTTLIHEYAHLLAVFREGLGAGNHGRAWKQAMKDLGEPPEIYHRLPVERSEPKNPKSYRCAKCGFEFVRARALPSHRTYQHRDCGGAIEAIPPQKGDSAKRPR